MILLYAEKWTDGAAVVEEDSLVYYSSAQGHSLRTPPQTLALYLRLRPNKYR